MAGSDEEEEWKGIDVDEPAKPQETTTKQALSGEEVRQIREASELYKSSSFKLQVRHHLLDAHHELTNIT